MSIIEDKIFQIICEEREMFQYEGPAKTMDDLWQRKAARRIMSVVDEYIRDNAGMITAVAENGR